MVMLMQAYRISGLQVILNLEIVLKGDHFIGRGGGVCTRL
jgi:hypothetical protein